MLLEARGTRRRGRPRLTRESLPAVTLGVGMLAVALFAALTAVRVTAVGLDENVYKYAAVEHYLDFPFGVLREDVSRGAARLYSLLIAPLFALFDGDVAVRAARALNGFLFAAAAVPVALLARRVTSSPWAAVAAGLLTIAVPWLTLATVLFSESLAYLLFCCVALAMIRALEAPSLLREAIVFALIFALVLTRIQFLVLLPAWVVLVAVAEVRAGRLAGAPRGARALLRRAWGRYRLTLAGVAGAVLLGLLVLAVGARGLAGPYYSIVERTDIPGNFGLALFWEVAMLSLGAGVLSAVLGVAWLARSLGAPEREDDFRFAALSVVVLALVFAATLWAQGGFLGANSEERYFIYAIPCLWIAAAAAVDRGRLSRRAILGGAVAIAAVVVLVPNPIALDGEQAYLGPVSLTLAHAMPGVQGDVTSFLGLSGGAVQAGDVLLGVCVLAVLALLVVWRRGRRARWLAVLPAVALQLFFVGYGFSSLYDELEGVGGTVLGASFTDLGWVDRATDGKHRVTLLDNQLVPAREGLQRNTMFWNDEVSDLYQLAPAQQPPPGFPVHSRKISVGDVQDDLTVTRRMPYTLALTSVDSPLWQFEARRLATSPGGDLALESTERFPRVRWAAFGLEADGQLTRPLRLLAAGGHRVTIDLTAPIPDLRSVATFRLGGKTQVFDSQRGADDRLTFDLCGTSGAVTGSAEPTTAIDITGRSSAALVRAVEVEPCR